MAAPATQKTTDDTTKKKDITIQSLNALFKLKAYERQKSVDLIMQTILKIIHDPNNEKLQDLNFDRMNDEIGDCEPALQLLYNIGFKIYSRDNANRLKIEVNGCDDVKLSYLQYIYDKMYYKKSARGLVHREQFNCKQLMTDFPPQYKDGRKKAVFKLIVPNGCDNCSGTLIYGRHQLIELPETIPDPTDFINNKIIIKPNIFQYISNTEDISQLHFYVNFADANLFGFYNGSLFAQDEIMTMEHPILAALREQLLAANTKQDSKLMPYCRGSVIILNALKHGHFTQKKLDKIYGGKFARSTIDKIKKSVTICNPPIIDNIICITSLMGCLQRYKQSQIEKLMKTAYCGFNGAVSEVLYQELKEKNKRNKGNKGNKGNNDEKEEKEEKEDKNMDKVHKVHKEIIVHTGNWGCGAFGGNIEVHTMIQIVAAVAAGIDMIYYHSVDKKSMKKAKDGLKVLLKELYPKCKNKNGRLKTKMFVAELLKKGYKWGTPNGT